MTKRAPLALAFALACAAAGCDKATAPPAPGALRVNTNTSGLDASIYRLRVDDSLRVIGPTDEEEFVAMSAGSHIVRLAEVPANCTVDSPNPQTVQVRSDETTAVQFNVSCVAVSGVVEVSTTTIGIDGNDRYQALIDGTIAYPVLATTVTALATVSGGPHTVELKQLGPNCSATNGASRSIVVGVGTQRRDTARVSFDVTCTAITGVMEVAFTATTPDFTDVFSLKLGNNPPIPVAVGATTRFPVLPAGDYQLSVLLPATCALNGSATQTVSIRAGGLTRDTTRVSLAAQCTRAEKIAFARGTSIEVINADGSNLTTLSVGDHPAWAPDGRQIALDRTNCDYYYDCYIQGLYRIDRRTGVVPDAQITREPDDYPSWSPDGKTIAFRHAVGTLALVGPDGTNFRTVPLPAGVVIEGRPAWSLDGTRLLFGCGVSNSGFRDVCTVGLTGTGFAYLTSDAQWNGAPSLSPDGTRILFTRRDFQTDRATPADFYVAVMNADGTGITRLATGTEAVWSADGTKLVFRSGSAQPGIYIMNANGTGVTRLTDSPDDHAPSWRP